MMWALAILIAILVVALIVGFLYLVVEYEEEMKNVMRVIMLLGIFVIIVMAVHNVLTEHFKNLLKQ